MLSIQDFRRVAAFTFLALAAFAPNARASPPTASGGEIGIASWYNQAGGMTASSERFNGKTNMAAHRSLPFGTLARVTNLDNGKSEVVRITDRGPFVAGRIIDLTPATASALGVGDKGLMHVKVEPIYIPEQMPRNVVQVSDVTSHGRVSGTVGLPSHGTTECNILLGGGINPALADTMLVDVKLLRH